MSEAKFTQEDWKAVKVDRHTWTVRSEDYGTIVTLYASHGVEAQRERLEPIAHLIAAAPAMDMALRMICLGIARIEACGSMQEFCFNGMRYILNGDWNRLMDVVGWHAARAALAKVEGGAT